MKKMILIFSLILFASVIKAQMDAMSFLNQFKYGMSKEEVHSIVDKAEQDGTTNTELGNKRYLRFKALDFYSDKLRKTVYFEVKFRYSKDVGLTGMLIKGWTGGSVASGGFSRKKATYVMRDLKPKFDDYKNKDDLSFHLNPVRSNYFTLYVPMVEVTLFD